MNNSEQQIADYLMPFDGKIQTLAQELREYLITTTKPKYELVGDSTISLNIGYGFSKKAWDCYCAIIVYSQHINISLPSGAALSDSENLLHGKGKRIRHLKLSSLDDLKTSDVSMIIEEARDLALSHLEGKLESSYDVETIIKPIAGTKKRPKR